MQAAAPDGGDGAGRPAPAPRQRRFHEGQQVRCQVPTCTVVMQPGQPGVRTSNLRYRICARHMRVAVLPGYAMPQRWCHKCSRRQPVFEFVGERRTCERVLRANCRKRRQARGGDPDDDPEDPGLSEEQFEEYLAREDGAREVAGAAGGGAAGAAAGGAWGAPPSDGRGRRSAAHGASRAQRLDAEEARAAEEHAARPRRRAAVPARSGAAQNGGFGASPLPFHMHQPAPGFPGGVMVPGATMGAAPAGGSMLFRDAVAAASMHAAPAGNRNAAAGLAVASQLLARAVDALAATGSASAAAATGAAGTLGAPALTGGGAAALVELAPPPPPPPNDALAQQLLAALVVQGAAAGGDAAAGLLAALRAAAAAAAPPPPPPPPPPDAAAMLRAALAEHMAPLVTAQLLTGAAGAAPGAGGGDPLTTATAVALFTHAVGQPGGADLLAALVEIAQEPPPA